MDSSRHRQRVFPLLRPRPTWNTVPSFAAGARARNLAPPRGGSASRGSCSNLRQGPRLPRRGLLQLAALPPPRHFRQFFRLGPRSLGFFSLSLEQAMLHFVLLSPAWHIGADPENPPEARKRRGAQR